MRPVREAGSSSRREGVVNYVEVLVGVLSEGNGKPERVLSKVMT